MKNVVFCLLGPSWDPLGALLGLLWGPLGLSWGGLRGPGGRLGASKTLKHTMKINDFCLFGPSWGSSWSALGASLGPLGPSWRHLGPSWRLWWPPRSVLEAILGILDALESARDVSRRRQSLGERGRCMRAGASWAGRRDGQTDSWPTDSLATRVAPCPDGLARSRLDKQAWRVAN